MRSRRRRHRPSPAHFHNVHLNSTDPAAAIDFYTSRFKARRAESAIRSAFVASPDAVVIELIEDHTRHPPLPD
jgi:hypothetical protein